MPPQAPGIVPERRAGASGVPYVKRKRATSDPDRPLVSNRCGGMYRGQIKALNQNLSKAIRSHTTHKSKSRTTTQARRRLPQTKARIGNGNRLRTQPQQQGSLRWTHPRSSRLILSLPAASPVHPLPSLGGRAPLRPSFSGRPPLTPCFVAQRAPSQGRIAGTLPATNPFVG